MTGEVTGRGEKLRHTPKSRERRGQASFGEERLHLVRIGPDTSGSKYNLVNPICQTPKRTKKHVGEEPTTLIQAVRPFPAGAKTISACLNTAALPVLTPREED